MRSRTIYSRINNNPLARTRVTTREYALVVHLSRVVLKLKEKVFLIEKKVFLILKGEGAEMESPLRALWRRGERTGKKRGFIWNVTLIYYSTKYEVHTKYPGYLSDLVTWWQFDKPAFGTAWRDAPLKFRILDFRFLTSLLNFKTINVLVLSFFLLSLP